MRIVQVIPNLALAGAEIMCENLTYELIKAGHNVTVISMYDYHSAITERLEEAGVDLRYLNKKNGLDFSMIPKMKKIFQETGAEVVHTHLYSTKYAIPAAMLAKVKCRVHTLHSIATKEAGSFARKINKFFFKHCSVTPVALSEVNRDTIVEEYGIKKENIPVIFNGTNLSRCKVKKDYSLNGKFTILHIGRFSPEKNHAGLIRAFHLFNQKYPDSQLWLMGDGEKRAEIESYVAEHDLSESVRFLGLQKDVYPFLQEADIFTLTSDYEGIPLTLTEAMGTGLPVAATAVGGIPDMLDEESALLVPVEIQKVAEAFEKYYLSEELRRTHGLAALKRSERFSAETMARKYLEIYLK